MAVSPLWLKDKVLPLLYVCGGSGQACQMKEFFPKLLGSKKKKKESKYELMSKIF